MTRPLPDPLWRCVNEALDARRSPWDDERVVDWLAEHPDDFAALEGALARVHLGGARAVATARPRRATLAAAAGVALAALLPLAARLAPPHADAPGGSTAAAPAGQLTVHAFEIQIDRATARGATLDTTGPFAHVDVRVETLTRRNPRR